MEPSPREDEKKEFKMNKLIQFGENVEGYSIPVLNERAQYCPGEVCTPASKQDIQRTSTAQILIIFGFAAFIFLTAKLFNDYFSEKPYDMFGINSTTQS